MHVGPLWIAVFILYKNWRSYPIEIKVSKNLGPVHANTSIDSHARYYRHFDAFPTVHTKTLENVEMLLTWTWTPVYACYEQKHLRYFGHRFHFDAFLLFSTVHSNTMWMRFRFDPLSRVFSNRCIFAENAQRGSVVGRNNASKCIASSNENPLVDGALELQPMILKQ